VPDAATRRKLLERLAQDYEVSVDPRWLTENTHGFSGDWITELLQTALRIAWLDERDEATTEDFEEALNDIDRNRSQVYTPTSELPVPSCMARSPEGSYA
jgi:AAA+ superfamily predicted ATPase